MKKKTNILRRNSGFMAGCVLAAGVSFFTADTIMSNGLAVLTETPESVGQQTTETIAQESSVSKVYETDPFTVTASGNIIKGVETENETETDANSETTAQTDAEGNIIGASGTLTLDEQGNIVSGPDSADGNPGDGSGSGTDSYSGDGSGSGTDSYSGDGSSWDGSYSGDGSSGDSYSSGGDGYTGEPIVIQDSGNGDYYYTDSSGGTGSTGGSSGSGGSSNTGSVTPGDVTGDFWSDSIMPDTYSRYIDESDLYIFSASEIRLIRNEIFARHGRIFDSSDLANYFSGKSWYVPLYTAAEFDSDWSRYLTDCEVANLNVILAYEEKLAGN